MTPGKKFFLFAVIAAFAAALCFVQINSAHADAHKLNTLYKVLGWGLTAVTGWFIYKTGKNSN